MCTSALVSRLARIWRSRASSPMTTGAAGPERPSRLMSRSGCLACASSTVSVASVKDGVWVVEDLGGERHEIVVSVDTKLTRETSFTAQDIKAGDRVQITGTKRDQQLQATDVTQR